MLVCLFSLASFAQKNVNVNNLRFEYWERQQPKTPLNPKYFHYATLITMPNSVAEVVDEASLYERLYIHGQGVTDNPTDDDYVLEMKLGPLKDVEATVMDRYVEITDRNGKVTGRDYYYWVEITYRMEANGELKKGSTSINKYRVRGTFDNMKHKTKEFSTRTSAIDFWNANKDDLKVNFARGAASDAMYMLSRQVSDAYGFPIFKRHSLIKTINEKKHPENLALIEKSNALKAKIESLTGRKPLKEEDLADIIDYFKGIPERYTDVKLKADIRLRYVAYYNLARIYLFLDQPEKVECWANLLFENGHDKKDCKRLTNDASKLQAYFNASDIKCRQFVPKDIYEPESVGESKEPVDEPVNELTEETKSVDDSVEAEQE